MAHLINKQKIMDALRERNARSPIVLHILTPCYGGVCAVGFVNCFLKTQTLLHEAGVKTILMLMGGESLIPRARNTMVSKAMLDETMTHMLFIDSDITWEPESVVRLLLHDRDVVGGVYPKKRYFWERLESIDTLRQSYDAKWSGVLAWHDFVRLHLVDYNMNLFEPPSARIVGDGLIRVQNIPTGFMMIRRSCIEEMIRRNPDWKYSDDCGFLVGEEKNRHTHAFFDCYVRDGRFMSEDWSFCHKWIDMGGDIFADINIALSHSGTEHYAGNLQVMAQKQQT